MRMAPSSPGLTAVPRHLIGAIQLPADVYAARHTDPAVRRFYQEWMRGKPIAPITLSATADDLVVR